MSTRKTPYALSENDRKNLCDAREALVRVRDSVPLVVRERMMASDGSISQLGEAIKRRKEFAEEIVNEIIAELEFILGYDS